MLARGPNSSRPPQHDSGVPEDRLEPTEVVAEVEQRLALGRLSEVTARRVEPHAAHGKVDALSPRARRWSHCVSVQSLVSAMAAWKASFSIKAIARELNEREIPTARGANGTGPALGDCCAA